MNHDIAVMVLQVVLSTMAGALGGWLSARGVFIDLLHRTTAAESFLRGRAAAESRAAKKAAMQEQIAQWRARGEASSPLDVLARQTPDRLRDDAIPR